MTKEKSWDEIVDSAFENIVEVGMQPSKPHTPSADKKCTCFDNYDAWQVAEGARCNYYTTHGDKPSGIYAQVEQPDSAAPKPIGFISDTWLPHLEIGNCSKTENWDMPAKLYSESFEDVSTPVYLHSPTKPQRITEQDVREIAQHYKNWRDNKEIGNLISVDEWLNNECRPLLAKLNGDIDD